MFKYGEFSDKMRINITNSSNSSNSNLNNYNSNNSANISTSSIKTSISSSVKEQNHITHPGISDKKRISFATLINNPYWPDNLWKDINRTLVYSYKNPEKCLKPPAYKTDKTIRFNSRFESGNLLYAYKLNQDAYHCIIDTDHSTSEQCQWFYFQMSNIQIIPNSNRKTTFYISGFRKDSSIISNGWKVFMYSEKMSRIKNISWFRTGSNYAYVLSKQDSASGFEHKSHRRKKQKINTENTKSYTLQFQVTFPYDDDVVYLCYGVPYTLTDLNTYITRWTSSYPSLISCTTLCQTSNRKSCPLLTITAPNSPSSIKKKCIFLTARSHPGESNGSLILHGLIDFLLSKQPSSEFLLHNFVFKIVPMINIDGVIDGSYHIGPNGENMNKSWSNPDPYKNPVVYHIKFLMKEIHSQVGIAAFIDFHGCSSEHGTFLYGCPYIDGENLPFSSINKEKIFPKILDSLCDLFDLEKCEFPQPKRRNEAARTVIRKEFGVINSFTFKTSFGGSTEGIWSNSLYVESNWKEIGAKIAESLFHLLSVDKPSYLLKSIENSKTFSNSSSPRSKSGNSSFDSLNSSRLDEDATVIAIDTEDGIKIISGNSNLGQRFDLNSDQNSPSKFNSSTNSNSNSFYNSNSRLGFKSESNSNSSSVSNLYSNSSFNSSYAPHSRIGLNSDSNSNSSTPNPRTKSLRNSSTSNLSSSSSNTNSRFSSNANSDSISNLSSYLASRINQNSKAADNQASKKPSNMSLSSESSQNSNMFLSTDSNSNSRYNSSASASFSSSSYSKRNPSPKPQQTSESKYDMSIRPKMNSDTNSYSKRNPSPKPQQNTESKYDMSIRPKMNSDTNSYSKRNPSPKQQQTSESIFKSSSASKRNPSPKSSSKSDSNFSQNQNLTTKNNSNIRTRMGTDSSLDVKPSSSSPRTNIGYSSESNFNPNRNQTSKSTSNIRSKFNSDSNSEAKPSLQSKYNSSPRSNYSTNVNSNTETKQNQTSKVYSSPKPSETKQNQTSKIYSSPKPTETKQSLSQKVYSSSDAKPSLLSKYNSSSESNSGLIQRPTSGLKSGQINRPASRTKLSTEAAELQQQQQLQLKQQSENNSFLNTSECTSSWSSFQSTSTTSFPSYTSFKNSTIPSNKRVTFQSDIIQNMKPPHKKKKS